MGHSCNCRADVSTCEAEGIAMFSDAPNVQPRLLDRFPGTACQPQVARATGPGFRQQVRSFLERCTTAEAESIKAALINEQGAFDPWSAQPVKQVLARLDTPWYPTMINNDGLLPLPAHRRSHLLRDPRLRSAGAFGPALRGLQPRGDHRGGQGVRRAAEVRPGRQASGDHAGHPQAARPRAAVRQLPAHDHLRPAGVPRDDVQRGA